MSPRVEAEAAAAIMRAIEDVLQTQAGRTADLKGSAVTWEFKASAHLNFNVHFHQGKEVSFPQKQDSVPERQGTLIAPSKEDYCWMWTNKGDAASNIRVLLAKATAKR